jgi:DNA-binding XRE family transcriptional regulator
MPRQPLTLPFSGAKSRALREENGLNLEQFANKIHEVTGYRVFRTTIGKIERGDYKPPAPLLKAMVDTFNKLAGKGTTVTVKDLLDQAAA